MRFLAHTPTPFWPTDWDWDRGWAKTAAATAATKLLLIAPNWGLCTFQCELNAKNRTK